MESKNVCHDIPAPNKSSLVPMNDPVRHRLKSNSDGLCKPVI
jgi:hypothetical protein